MKMFPPFAASAVLLLLFISAAECQQDFTRGQVPIFTVGVFYPGSSNNPILAEKETCRTITDRIDRNSARFNSELVTNTNGRINFATPDSRLMSSRMQSRLDDLAQAYNDKFNRRMTVLKAWTPFPDSDLQNEPESLHYEGRTVRVRLPVNSHYDNFLELAVGDAAFDWVYYATSSYIRLSVIPSNCVRNVDCVFLLDRSGSVGSTNHNIALQFINSVVSFFSISRNSTKVGMAAYSSSSTIQFDLNRYSSASSLQTAISNVRFTGGSTNTPAALDDASILLNPANNRGARVNSLGIPKIAILITDGRSNRGNLAAAASALRNSGVQVYTVGIGNIDVGELRSIASDPDDEHVFILSSFLDAAGFVDFLSITTCDTPAIIDPGDNTTTTNPDGGIKYFQTECLAFSNKILVELIDTNGTSFLYCSALETNPGPLTPDTVRNETMGITRRTGIVRLPGEQKVVYIGVQGQGMSDSFTLIVWDQLFDPVDAFIDVVEGALRGVTIYEVRNNLTAATLGHTYEYSIIEGNEDGIFAIDGTTGRVFIPQSGSPGVNFGTRRTHNLTVQAVNTQQDCQRARIRINIRVISNQITFGDLPEQVVAEDAALQTSVVRVVATGGAGEIAYSILSGNINGAFSIGSGGGLVRVSGPLNFETRNSYTLRVRAVSVGTTVEGEINLVIHIADVNEIHEFVTVCALDTGGCRYNLDENLPSTVLGTVTAEDLDLSSSPNGTLTYRIDSFAAVPFSVDSRGEIRTTRSLDRELRNSYSFMLIVMDGCSSDCSFSIQTNIIVTVNDVNDNPPVYTLTRDVTSLPEDAAANSVVAQYIATDADAGSNAEIVYSLTSAPSVFPFLFSQNGILTLNGGLDFEMTQSYLLTVTASNPGNVFPTPTNTVIQVTNVNDNSPMFIAAPYVGVIEENSQENTLLLTVMANDDDLGIHGEVLFFIVGGNFNNSFRINSQNGNITVRNNIDRETITSFTLVVEVKDRGTPQQRRARTTVAVTVGDVNDNPPIFQPDSYTASIREDAPVSRDVVLVIASDADEPNNPNSQIQYSIFSGNAANRFTIDATTGQIELMNELDFETVPSYELTVTGRDGGNPVMSGSATVSITVINVNENPPTLMGNQVVNISESAPEMSTVAVFVALDPDQMAVTFTITSGNGEDRFEIGDSSGMITLKRTLDYETTTRYILGIRASDGQQSANAQLTVNVIDENEFAPVFMGEVAFTITEERPDPVTTVGRVMATDGDRDAVVRYSFVSQDSATSLFSLDPQSGEITTRNSLNREALTQVFNPPLSIVTVQIAATDNGSPSMRTLQDYTITLRDINDNAPIFLDSSYANMLQENLPANQLVFQAVASDADLGSNAEITYSFTLSNNLGNTNPFVIDASTGAITTTASLDCEQQPFYLFTIVATDGGTPSLSASVTGNLTIIDVNDNSPVFDLPVYTKTLREDSFDVVFLTVRALDADKGRNGEVRYSIRAESRISQNLEGSDMVTEFFVDPVSGDVININAFDFESAAQINITIFANDTGFPHRFSTTLVILTITNVDERPPIFPSRSCDVFVPEDISIGGLVTVCPAEDLDSTATPDQDKITYSFSSPHSLFEVDQLTAEIRTVSQLDRESGAGYSVTIIATDAAGRTSTRRVVIRVSDVNDNAPTFQNTPYAYQFTRSAVGTVRQFLTVGAVDMDRGENGTFSLRMGNVVTNTARTESLVTIIATDNGSPQRSNSVSVSVTFEESCQLQEYTLTESGELSATLLCSVEITPTTLPLVIGGEKVVTCRIVSNTFVGYQWLHNSTAVTSQVVVAGGEGIEVTFTITNTQFSDAGEYACLVTSSAGSLQTAGASAAIQVAPTITTPPQDMAVTLGSTAAFTCAAVGLPPPTIEWFRKETELVREGNVLVLPNVDASIAGTYTCRVSNEVGNAASAATLTVFDPFNILQLDVGGISSPSKDGSCQHFDSDILESALSDLTNQRAVVTSIEGGDLLCEVSACSPSPCKNGGECRLDENVVGGYVCTCRQGYTGVNCMADESECDQDPCGDEGQCTDTLGSFSCSCNTSYTGRRCQLRDTCSQTPPPCSEGESCVETFTASGYQCITPDQNTSLTVGGATVDAGELNDLIQLFIERESALSNGRRRRRQTSTERLTTICEPRFIAIDQNQLLLIWLCPEGEGVPSPEVQYGLCDYLFEIGVVTTCKLPLGEFMTTPITPPLPSVDLKLTVIIIDSSTNKPIDALDSVKLLEEANAEEQLSQRTGLQVSAITAQESEPRPEPRPQEGGSNSGAIVGGVFGGLLIVVLLIIVGVVIALARVRNERLRQQRKKTQALQMSTLEGGNDTRLEGSMDQLLSIDGSPMAPKRPPKPASVPSVELNEDIYQNVTKIELSSPTSTVKDDHGNLYDALPTKANIDDQDDNQDDDYDNLPPKKANIDDQDDYDNLPPKKDLQ